MSIALTPNKFYYFVNFLVGFFYQTTMIMSLRYERATLVSIIEATSLIFSFIYDTFATDSTIHLGSYIGGAFVFLGTGLLMADQSTKAPDVVQ